MIPGTPFLIPLSSKYIPITRSTYLRNPLDDNTTAEQWVPWKRLCLFFDTDVTEDTEMSFDILDPLTPLATKLGVSHTATMSDLAQAVLAKLNEVSTTWQSRYVRKRLQAVNKIHCESLSIEVGRPRLDAYDNAEYIEEHVGGQVIRVARLCDGAVWRRGSEPYTVSDNYNPDIHPIAKRMSTALHGGLPNVRFDHLQSGPWGLRIGLLGWNTRAYNVGAVLGAAFGLNPSLYDSFDTTVFTDKQGRPCNYYGWHLSSTEMCSTTPLYRLMVLLGHPTYKLSQISQANQDVVAFLDDTKLNNVSSIDARIMAFLFFGYIYLNAAEWESVSHSVQEHRIFAACQDICNRLCLHGMRDLVETVSDGLGIGKQIGELLSENLAETV